MPPAVGGRCRTPPSTAKRQRGDEVEDALAVVMAGDEEEGEEEEEEEEEQEEPDDVDGEASDAQDILECMLCLCKARDRSGAGQSDCTCMAFVAS